MQEIFSSSLLYFALQLVQMLLIDNDRRMRFFEKTCSRQIGLTHEAHLPHITRIFLPKFALVTNYFNLL